MKEGESGEGGEKGKGGDLVLKGMVVKMIGVFQNHSCFRFW